MTLVEKGSTVVKSNTTRFMLYTTASARFTALVRAEWVSQRLPIKAKLMR